MLHRLLFLLIVLCLLSFQVMPHAGIGLVKDSQNNVFFTDLKHVWKIDAKGVKTIAVENVHTHELMLDNQDNLYGEHLWYIEAENKWMHRVWKRSPTGVLLTVLPEQAGFLTDFGFVHDSEGFQYRINNDTHSIERFLPVEPTKDVIHKKLSHFVQWLHISKKDEIFYIDGPSLMKYVLGAQSIASVKQLESGDTDWQFDKNKHDFMGLTSAGDGKLFIAHSAERNVLSIDSFGDSKLEYEGRWPWTPTGVMVDRDNVLWVLEYSALNSARVRKIVDGKVMQTY